VAPWRTKVGGGRVVEHTSKDAVDAVVDDARRRYRAGARALRVVRVYDPDGGVRLIDFEAEARDAQRALRDVERATARKDREVRAALDRWELTVARAVGHGEPVDAVADAAGISAREVRAIVRRHAGPTSERR
jgi:DNA-binding NarL/FixJ family response regulator